MNCSWCYLSLQCLLLNFVSADCRITNGYHKKIIQLQFLRRKVERRFFFSYQLYRKPERSLFEVLLSRKIADLPHMYGIS